MASITVRNLDEGLKRRLRIRAAENGKSMEQEVRDILRAALDEGSSERQGFGMRVRENGRRERGSSERQRFGGIYSREIRALRRRRTGTAAARSCAPPRLSLTEHEGYVYS